MTSHERKLRAARAYLNSRGLLATATDSQFRYRNSNGVAVSPPAFIDEQRKLQAANEVEAVAKVKTITRSKT